MNPRNCPGYGDEATWPDYVGHPNDPRNDGPEWDEMTDDERRIELESWTVTQLVDELLRLYREGDDD